MIIRTITLLVCLQRFVRASKTMTLGSSRLRGSHPGDQRGLQGPGYSDAELQYFRECEDSLLGETVIADGLISQEEFASAYASFCAEYAASSRGCPSSSFDSLPKGIQDNFFQAVCETMPDPARCATNLRSLNTMPFGYIVSDETMPKVQMQVQGLCLMLLDDVFASESTKEPAVLPARSPTTSPTVSPTAGAPVADASSFGNEPLGPLDDEDTGGDSREPVGMPTPESDEDEKFPDLPSASDEEPPGFPKATSITRETDPSSRRPIIGIAVVAVACLFLLLIAAYRRRRCSKDKKQQLESDDEGIYENDPEAPDRLPNALVVKKGSTLANFDPSLDAAAIALKMSSDASSASRSSFGRGFLAPPSHISLEQIETAVDKACWDEVYKFASQLAEQDDLSTVSSVGLQQYKARLNDERMERRSHLREEDYERTRTLDELIENRDWTGVAVTAALYAGESGYQRQSQPLKTGSLRKASRQRASNAALEAVTQAYPAPASPAQSTSTHTIETKSDTTDELDDSRLPSKGAQLLHLKDSMDYAVDRGDWDQVVRISSEVENNGTYQSRNSGPPDGVKVSLPSTSLTTSAEEPKTDDVANFNALINEMDRAMNRGDWALVAFYADKIREMKISGNDSGENSPSHALVPLRRPQQIHFAGTEDTSASITNKKNTLGKLVQAEKWKGVAIMAGLYEMEAKGSLSAASESS